jgi:hypothetical protein
MFIATPAAAQDFYGANLTGKHTWGFNVKYNGDFWVGTHYNIRRFGGFGSRPLDFNIVAEIKIDKGIGGIGTELGFSQVYADGKDFASSFGLGARYGLRAEYCPIMYKDKEENKTSYASLSVNAALKPGYYSNAYSVAGNLDVDIVKFNFGCSKMEQADNNFEVDVFGRLGVGLHSDWTNALNGKGRYHLTFDAKNNFYFGDKPAGASAAWNTYYDLKDYPSIKGDYTGEGASEDVPQIGSCDLPERNFDFKLSQSVRF